MTEACFFEIDLTVLGRLDLSMPDFVAPTWLNELDLSMPDIDMTALAAMLDMACTV